MLLAIPLVAAPVMLLPGSGLRLRWGERWLRLGAVVGVLVLTLGAVDALQLHQVRTAGADVDQRRLGAPRSQLPEHLLRPGLGFWSLQCGEAFPVPATEDQSQHSARYRAEGVHYARTHLSRLPFVALAREGRVWSAWRVDQMVWLNVGEGREQWASRIGVVQWWLLVPLAVVGAVVLRRRRVSLLPLLAMFALVAIVALAFYGIPRFRLPGRRGRRGPGRRGHRSGPDRAQAAGSTWPIWPTSHRHTNAAPSGVRCTPS